MSGRERKHVPDFLLCTDAVPIVVDVKPGHRVARPENAFTFAWTKRVVESKGWWYQVCSEPPRVELENVRFLAGYRRDWLFETGLLGELGVADLDGLPLGEALKAAPGYPRPLVRSALLHLLWTQHFTFDLTVPLNHATMLRRLA
ncbi:hypothetical protein SAMN05216215_1018151 [Saccharopolyspora shandongensis]|uniref:TnsA endonuclease N terminal n=1 Tax=Saccharopolyspora shandongensis TaxID=418495 RepID=A0A1H3GEX3_9PSEU|nr:hypothetical protein SAMN05216215_1018151 [Saccharopolyspora shandongensis]